MIYILEFDRPLGSAKHQARYYLGWCEDGTLDRRLAAHRSGQGAAITRAAIQQGIVFEVAATLPGDRSFERQLKRRKNHRRIVEQARRCNNP